MPLYAAAAPDALEPDILFGAGAAALLFTGAGRIALDNGRTWQRRPLPYAWLCLISRWPRPGRCTSCCAGERVAIAGEGRPPRRGGRRLR